MKLEFNKKHVIISVIFFLIITIILLLLKNLFFIEGNFYLGYFIVSFITVACLSFALCVKVKLDENTTKTFTIVNIIFSVFYLTYIIELLNMNNIFCINILRLLFNFILISMFYIFIFCISNKVKFSIIFSNVILFLLAFANYSISTLRGTPLSILDILSLHTGLTILTTYTIEFNFYLLLAIISFLLLIVLNLKVNYKINSCKKYIIIRLIIIFAIIIITALLFLTDLINIFGLNTYLWVPADEYHDNGFLASFFKQTKELIVKEPDNYSLEKVEDIYSSLEESVPTNSTINTDSSISKENEEKDLPNIIVIMNESFSDMTVHRDFKTNEDYLSYFYSICENNLSGNVHTSVYGGKTPNSEWEFLTNNSMSLFSYGTVPYQQFISKNSYSLVSTLESQGYTSYAIHPWYKTGYRRNSVYPLFGFDKSLFYEDLKDKVDLIREYPSDLSTYKQIVKLYEEKDENENFFNFTITMQNHSGYDYNGNNFKNTITLTDIENCPRVEQYLSLLKLSDDALKYLIEYFTNVDENTIILFFGDHQPPYIEDEFWDYLNVGKDNSSLADAEKGYITPYFIWTNYDVDFSKYETNDISLNYLSILLLDIAGLDTTPYMDFLREMQKEIPVITGHGYMDSTGTYHNLDERNEYTELINNYHILQYNNMFERKDLVTKMFKIQ